MPKKFKYLNNYTKLSPKLHEVIAHLYQGGHYTTETIAKNYGVTVRTVQRIAAKYGVVRTISESNKLIAPLKNYKTIPPELRVKRRQITQRLRWEMISAQPWCTVCGRRPNEGVALEIDHIDENPSNNSQDNLQVLCAICNQGKSHHYRFGDKPQAKEMTRLEKITALKQTAPR